MQNYNATTSNFLLTNSNSTLIPVLYLTRNGLLEPLGQSQVLAYLRGLSEHFRITVISYEKPEDWADQNRMQVVRDECERFGIRWCPQRFLGQPKLVAPAVSMVHMLLLVLKEVKRGKAGLIHARSYIPAAVALAVRRLTGVPFIFDMRAIWPEELITAGRLRRGSITHRAIVATERACLHHAAGVVLLTHAAADHLRQVYPGELADQRIVVIPTCADLERFKPSSTKRLGSPVHGCIGTVLSGWFRIDWLAQWFSVVSNSNPETRFELITRDDLESVRRVLDAAGGLGDRLTIRTCLPEAMPQAILGHDLSVMFYAGGEISELGRSPTRMAEVLGCGLPVVANAGVGDVARIMTENRVGVLVDGPGDEQIKAALNELEVLMADPQLPARCRATAEALFSLEAGTEAYHKLYTAILARGVT